MKMEKLDLILILVTAMFVLGMIYEHHVVDVNRAENALAHCNSLGYKSYLGYRGYIFNSEATAIRCTYPQQEILAKNGDTPKMQREGYL